MNEEAMTPDKEQVVERLNADEEAIARRTHRPTSRTVPFIWVESGEKDERVETSCARCEEEWPCGASRLLATLDAERGDRERQFREWKAAQDISVAEWQRQIDTARTASVTGLDVNRARRCIAQASVYLASGNIIAAHDELEAAVAALNSAPSIEQEPGEARYFEPGCVFCEKATGNPDRVMVFEPLNPVTPGHLLVVPTAHARDATEWPDITAYVMERAAEVARAAGPCNLITSVGHEATQSVFHLHVHVVPRRAGDGLALPWSEQEPGETLRAAACTAKHTHCWEHARAALDADPQETER